MNIPYIDGITGYINALSFDRFLIYLTKISIPEFVQNLGISYVLLYLTIGGLLLFYVFRKVFVLIYTLFIMREKNLKKRYGRDGWA